MALTKEKRRLRIRRRIRKTISGSVAAPRLSVFRSNKEIYAQIIDDESGKTIVAASSREKEIVEEKLSSKIDIASIVGKRIGFLAKKAGVSQVKFDRGGYLYHGRVKSLAEGAREGGLKF